MLPLFGLQAVVRPQRALSLRNDVQRGLHEIRVSGAGQESISSKCVCDLDDQWHIEFVDRLCVRYKLYKLGQGHMTSPTKMLSQAKASSVDQLVRDSLVDGICTLLFCSHLGVEPDSPRPVPRCMPDPRPS